MKGIQPAAAITQRLYPPPPLTGQPGELQKSWPVKQTPDSCCVGDVRAYLKSGLHNWVPEVTGTFAPRNFRSRERKFHGTFVP